VKQKEAKKIEAQIKEAIKSGKKRKEI